MTRLGYRFVGRRVYHEPLIWSDVFDRPVTADHDDLVAFDRDDNRTRDVIVGPVAFPQGWWDERVNEAANGLRPAAPRGSN